MRKWLFAIFALIIIGAQPADAKTLGVALASDTNPFYIAMRKGIEARAKELGWTVRFVTANEDVTSQVNGVGDLVAQGVDGILISPIDAVAARPAYAAAKKAGIPIMSIARTSDTPDQVAYIAMDEIQIGRDIGKWLIAAIGGKGEIAVAAGPAGAATFRNLATGLMEVVGASPDVKVVFRKDLALTREEGLRVAQDILVAHPNVKAIYCGNDELALGVAQAIGAVGKTGQIVVTGLNGIPPAVAAVKKGEIGLTVELNPVKWGTLGVDTMSKWLSGERNFNRVNIPHVLLDKTNAK